MTSTSTFTTSDFDVTDYVPPITTGLPTGHLRMNKTYVGEVEGRSVTQFTSAFDQSSGVGTYVAMESFEGTVDGRSGAFPPNGLRPQPLSRRRHPAQLTLPFRSARSGFPEPTRRASLRPPDERRRP